MSLKRFYTNIKKEHIFIFLVILTALILFNYFNFNYTGLSTKTTCYSQGYSCCLTGTGQGNYYFSLDSSCNLNEECWDYCSNNVITTKASFIDSLNKFFNDVKQGFNKIFGKQTIGSGTITPDCNCNYDFDCPVGDTCDSGAGSSNPVGCYIDTREDPTLHGLCGVSNAQPPITPPAYGLTVNKGGTGFGTIISDPAGISCGVQCQNNYDQNTQIMLTAQAEPGSEFAGWGGDCSGTSCVLILDSNKTATATFNPIKDVSNLPDCDCNFDNECLPGHTCEYSAGLRTPAECTIVTGEGGVVLFEGLCKLSTTYCGNGVKEGAEECDDNNLVDGDGCSSICKNEQLVLSGAPSITKIEGIPIGIGIKLTWNINSVTNSYATPTGATVLDKNLLTGNIIKDDINKFFNNVVDFFKKLFGKKVTGAKLEQKDISGFIIRRDPQFHSIGSPDKTVHISEVSYESGEYSYQDADTIHTGIYAYQIKVVHKSGAQSGFSEKKIISYTTPPLPTYNLKITLLGSGHGFVSVTDTQDNQVLIKCGRFRGEHFTDCEKKLDAGYHPLSFGMLPDDDSTFARWGGDCPSKEICGISNINEPIFVEATFNCKQATCVDTVAPTIESVSPVLNAQNIPLNTNIIVTFSEPMDTTLTESSFSLKEQQNPITGVKSWSNSDKTLTFDPSSDLLNNKQYTITITTAAKDKAGISLAQEYTSTFTTLPGVDTQAPIVLSLTSVGGDMILPYETSDSTPDVSFTTDENAYCRISLTDQSYDEMMAVKDCSAGIATGTTTHTCTSPDLGSIGAKNIYISCKDSSNNQNTALNNEDISLTLKTRIDTQSPIITIISSVSSTVNNPLITLSGTASISSTTSTNSISKVQLQLNSGSWIDATLNEVTPVNPKQKTWTKQLTLVQGSNNIKIKALDNSVPPLESTELPITIIYNPLQQLDLSTGTGFITSFESQADLDKWTCRGIDATNVAQPVNEFYTGQKSIKITSNTGKFSVCELPIKVKENTKYILNAKFKCAPDSSTGHSGALFMGSFPYTNSQATKVLCSNQWQDISLTLNTVSSLTGLSYGMNIYGEFEDGPSTGGSSGSVLYDDLIVVDNILSPTATLLTPSATTNVPLNTKINIRFSKPMDRTTTQGVFTLTTKDILNQDVQIPGTKTWKDYDRELEFTQSSPSPLQPNKTYTITITTAAKDKADKQLQTQFTSSFTTSLGTSTLSACATNGCSTENSRRCSLTSPTTTPQVCTKDNPTTPTCLKWVDQTVCAAPQTCQVSTGQCGTPSTEICNNNIDDDNDGIYDGLDKDCATGEKVTIQSITVTDTKPFEEADFEIQCKIAVSGATATLARAEPCIISNLSKGTLSQQCEFLKRSNDILRFRCNAGALDNNKVASCKVNTEKCNGDLADLSKNIAQKYINVTAPNLCTKEIGQERLNIIDIDVSDKEYKSNDKIKPQEEVENLDNEDLSITTEVYLYDINSKQQLTTTSQNKLVKKGLTIAKFNPELITPAAIAESKHRLYFKTYLKDAEDEICLQDSLNIRLKASSTTGCPDLDRDGYSDKICGGNDCNDANARINPNATEICNDNLDNNCNSLIDVQDPVCSGATICTNGQTRECGFNIGICKKGTQTCTNNVWGNCAGEVKPSQEICDDVLDNNCNGLTDCSDSACSSSPNCEGIVTDTDNDGLPDNWELKYFNNLNQNSEGDYDNDGFTNLQEYSSDTDPTNSSSHPSKKSSLIIVIIVVIILGVAGFLVWIFALRPKKPMPDLTSKPLSKSYIQQSLKVSPILLNYIKSSLQKGYTKQQIKTALMMKGWSEKDIEEAFKYIK